MLLFFPPTDSSAHTSVMSVLISSPEQTQPLPWSSIIRLGVLYIYAYFLLIANHIDRIPDGRNECVPC